MPLTAGQTLAHYTLLAPLGAGGMGEVWRARDGRLGREIAIKVLPEAFVADEERLKRFEREAQVLASLSHLNLYAIHGIDQQDDTCFLVLELVPGESLSDRLLRGPLPLPEALDVCRQIAAGLEAAHEAGVVHRDLKPANVRVTPDGVAKVLDFGLAKPAPTPGSGTPPGGLPDSVLVTQEGLVLGTPTYMSPEQARGRPVDRRTDIWAFGCTLYECLAGQRAFGGSEVLSVLHAIQTEAPDWSRLPADTPAHVRHLLRRCLEKDPRRRLRDIGEARLALETPTGATLALGDWGGGDSSGSGSGSGPGSGSGSGSRSGVGVGVGAHEGAHAGAAFGASAGATRARLPWALAVAALAVAAWAWVRPPATTTAPPAPPPATRWVVEVELPGRRIADGIDRVAVSPDGRSVAYTIDAADDSPLPSGLYLRELGALEPRRLVRSYVDDVCFSPDGRWIAYRDSRDDMVRRVRVDGGLPLDIAPAEDSTGLAWDGRGRLVFTRSWGEGLSTLSVEGATFATLTSPDLAAGERNHIYPRVLPDGETMLHASWTGARWEQARLIVTDLSDGTGGKTVLGVNGTCPRYVPLGDGTTGALVWAHTSSLWAQRFDPARRALLGDPVQVLDGVAFWVSSGRAVYDVSAGGTLAYVPGTAGAGERALVWVDREGNEEPVLPAPGPYTNPTLSLDGSRMVLVRIGPVYDVCTVDLTRPLVERRMQRLPTEDDAYQALLSPDGTRVAYTTNPGGAYGVYVRGLEPTAVPRLVFPLDVTTRSWSRDGRYLAYGMTDAATGNADLHVLDLQAGGGDGEASSRPLVATRRAEYDPQLSPDGRWVAYVAQGEDGEYDVHVASFPDGVHALQVTRGGADSPRWSLDGTELYFRTAGVHWAVPVDASSTFTAGTPVALFEGHYGSDESYGGDYAIGPDGRFLMLKPGPIEDERVRLVIVEHWATELEAALR